MDNNDGCSSTCKVETGFTCIGGDTNNRDICSEVCGDGVVYVDTATNWDDGNLLDGDGCSHDWLVEYGYTWNGGTPSSPDVCKAKCGDGILLSNVEQCDDGNIKISDGCDTYCIVESGFQCTTNYSALVNSVCTEVCGDSKHMWWRHCIELSNFMLRFMLKVTIEWRSGYTHSWTGLQCKFTRLVEVVNSWCCTEACGDSKHMGVNVVRVDDGNTKDIAKAEELSLHDRVTMYVNWRHNDKRTPGTDLVLQFKNMRRFNEL